MAISNLPFTSSPVLWYFAHVPSNKAILANNACAVPWATRPFSLEDMSPSKGKLLDASAKSFRIKSITVPLDVLASKSDSEAGSSVVV